VVRPGAIAHQGRIDTEDRSIGRLVGGTMLHRGLKLAKQQGALFWELRNALSLARLWVGQDRRTDARQILEPVCGAFAEGFQIADVREAKTMLDGLDADYGHTSRHLVNLNMASRLLQPFRLAHLDRSHNAEPRHHLKGVIQSADS